MASLILRFRIGLALLFSRRRSPTPTGRHSSGTPVIQTVERLTSERKAANGGREPGRWA